MPSGDIDVAATPVTAAPPAGGAPSPDAPDESKVFASVYALPRLELASGRGSRVTDAAGREYLDFVSGIAVNALGHAHPGLRRAVHRQMAGLNHVSNLYANGPALELGKALLAATGYDRLFLCNSGSEANEAALKFARLHARAAGRPDGTIIAFEGGFHGRTAFALSVTANPKYREPFAPLVPGIVFAPLNDAAGFDAVLDALPGPLTALLVEPVQGEAGGVVATKKFLAHLRARATERGALLIFDEVQIGAGRSGRYLAADLLGVRADITVMAKGLGGGFPIGATLLTAAAAAPLAPGHHGTTFGGNPVAAAAALYVLGTVNRPAFLGRVRRHGKRLAARLAQLVAAHPSLGAARGLGLLQAVELSDRAGYDAAELVAAAREAGLLVCRGGDKSVRLLPPLNVSQQDLDEAVARLEAAVIRLESEKGYAA